MCNICFSSMLAIAHDNFMVTIVDLETRRVVREFNGHTNSITDMVLKLGFYFVPNDFASMEIYSTYELIVNINT